MQIFLELSGHPKANIKRVALAGTTVVGRSKLCGLQIASASVSRKHCEIRLGEETATIVDLGSSNGTFIGSERLVAGEEHPLPEDSRLNVGGVRFLVSYTDPREAKVEPTVDSAGQSNGEPVAEAAPLAAAAAVADEPLSTDDAPLPLDDDDLLTFAGDDDLLTFAGDEEQQERGGEAAATKADEDEVPSPRQQIAPVIAEEEDRVAADDSRNDGSILGGEVLLAAEGEEPLLAADSAEESPAPVGFEDETTLAPESAAKPGEMNGVPDEETFEEFVEPDPGGSEGEIFAESDNESDNEESILAFDDDDDAPFSDETPSDSNLNLADSAPLVTEGHSRNGQQVAPARPTSDAAAEDSLEDDSEGEELLEDDADEDYFEDEEDSETIAAESLDEEQGDEPILEDEDEAFAFLNDDDSASTPKTNKNDSQLGDFLSQLGRD